MYLELPSPNLEDNVTDIARVSRELRRKLGWHSFDMSLACLQHLSDTLRESDWKVTATLAKDKGRFRIQKLEPLDTSSRNYGLAVDVGTTTVVAQLVDLRLGKVLGVEGSHNLQAQYGEDVISRMVHACGKGGLHPLHDAVVKNINTLIESLSSTYHVPRESINAIVAAGNTTMSHFLLGLTPCNIRLEPYVPTADVYPQILASDIGIQINPRGVLETIPSVASYVGGDIVAGIVASGIISRNDRLGKEAFFAADAGGAVDPRIINYYMTEQPASITSIPDEDSDLRNIAQDENFLDEINGTNEDDNVGSSPDFKTTSAGRPVDIDIDQYPSAESLAKAMRARGLEVDPNAPRGKLVDQLLSDFLEPTLIQPTFLYDYPRDISPLTKSKPGDPQTVERFEGFIAGMELRNAFSELNDPIDQEAGQWLM